MRHWLDGPLCWVAWFKSCTYAESALLKSDKEEAIDTDGEDKQVLKMLSTTLGAGHGRNLKRSRFEKHVDEHLRFVSEYAKRLKKTTPYANAVNDAALLRQARKEILSQLRKSTNGAAVTLQAAMDSLPVAGHAEP